MLDAHPYYILLKRHGYVKSTIMTPNLKRTIIQKLHLGIYSDWIYIVIILLCTFLFLAFFFNAWSSTVFLGEVFSSLSGAAIVAIITLFLLDGQTKSENETEQNSAIFRKKLEIYQEFLNSLNSIVANKILSDSDKINLQFQVAYISIHTESKRLKAISGQVNSIIRKLELENPIKNNIYDELYKLSVEIHNELYNNKWDSDNSDLQSAIQNFACLRVSERNDHTYKKLLWLEDSVSLYPLRTRIVGYKDLVIKIDILTLIKSQYGLTSSEMNVVVHIENDMSGSIYLYTDEQTEEGLQQILHEKTLWRYKHELKCQNTLLDVHYIKNIAVLCAFEKDSPEESYLKCLYDALGMMYPLWWENGMNISRRKIGSSTNEIQVLLSFQKEDGTIGTVIDESII